jgi:hypothetical protein
MACPLDRPQGLSFFSPHGAKIRFPDTRLPSTRCLTQQDPRSNRNPCRARHDDGPSKAVQSMRPSISQCASMRSLFCPPFPPFPASEWQLCTIRKSCFIPQPLGRPPQFKSTKPPRSSAQIHPVRRARFIKRLDAKASSRFSFEATKKSSLRATEITKPGATAGRQREALFFSR